MARKTRKTRQSTEQRAAQLAELTERVTTFEGETDEATLAQILALYDGYSARNAMLIASQDPEATDVSGFHSWKDRGRSVMPRTMWPAGADSIKILAPAGSRTEVKDLNGSYGAQPAEHDVTADTETRTRRFFKIATVFDVRLTEPTEVAEARWAAQAAAKAEAATA